MYLFRVLNQIMDSTKSTDIAEFVREIRRSLNCTQEELAAQLGVTFSTANLDG